MTKHSKLEEINLDIAISSGLLKMQDGELSIDEYRKAYRSELYNRREQLSRAIAEAKEELYRMRNEYQLKRYSTSKAYIEGIENALKDVVHP